MVALRDILVGSNHMSHTTEHKDTPPSYSELDPQAVGKQSQPVERPTQAAASQPQRRKHAFVSSTLSNFARPTLPLKKIVKSGHERLVKTLDFWAEVKNKPMIQNTSSGTVPSKSIVRTMVANQSLCQCAESYSKSCHRGEGHPDLVKPTDDLGRVFQVGCLSQSTIAVFDKAYCLDFASMNTRIRRSTSQNDVIFSEIRESRQRGSILNTKLRKIDGRYVLHASFIVWHRDTCKLWTAMCTYRRQFTSYQPCSHLDFFESSHVPVVCPSSANCHNFCKVFDRVDAEEDKSEVQWHYCDDVRLAALRAYGSITTESPLDANWMKLAAKVPDAVVSPDYPAEPSSILRAWFDEKEGETAQ
ncbi:hypothetical protein ANO11243_055880 [Dothideomycetidae sp. 11243]|nr:hypothetical protein ANO11243_055880 [fungal sp. No.11243]